MKYLHLRTGFFYNIKRERHSSDMRGWASMIGIFLRCCIAAFALVAASTQAHAQVNDAQFVSQSVPATMTAGQPYTVSVTMKNTGTTTWTAADGYFLGSQNPQDNQNWGFNRVSLTAVVAPGQQTTFSFTVTAPSAAGTHHFQWRMVKEYVAWFGATSTNVAVTVSAPQINDAQFVSQNVPSTMTIGQSYIVSVTMKNTGTTTWTAADEYYLGSQNPQDNKNWGTFNRISLTASVAPSQQYTFNFTVMAPSTAGVYQFQWKMVKEYVGWFGTASANVAVTTGSTSTSLITPPPASATRTTGFQYDAATGLLIREIIEPDNTQFRLETAYAYDAWGNRTSATVSSPATGTAAIAERVSTTAYDARGQFPVSSTNALLQQESRIVDPKFGAMTALTGPNALTTQWQYDSFGRRTLEIRADGTRTKWEYLYCNGIHGGTASCPGFAKYLIQLTPLASDGVTVNGPWKKTYFDELDREVRSETVGFDGASLIAADIEYDNLGRAYKRTRPYYSGQAPQWTITDYDVLNRAVTITAPDNTKIQFSYNGLTTTVTNALGQPETKVSNSRGNLTKVTDAAGGSMTYQYDPFGNPWKTTDAKGNAIMLAYDLRGRKTQMADPDMGGWRYDYNVLGELVSQINAKGQTATMVYDRLGRMTSRSEPDLVSIWTYDSCAKGVGKLCKASADNGYVQTVGYDSYGRASSTSTTIDTVYSASVLYDAHGRIAAQLYPNGFGVKYGYTSLGYLKEVRDNASNALYWSAGAMDAEGRLLQQTYGNNVLTQQMFEASTGRFTNIHAGAGNSVQNLSYAYDSIGNLMIRSDANQNLLETFLYDSLNRLTSSTVNAGGASPITQTTAYDSIGNLQSRSGIGTYTYGTVNNRPHAVASIALTAGGQRQYTYDANGNLTGEVQTDASGNVISGKGRTATYTSFDMPKTLTASGTSVSFVYSTDHQRVKETAPGVTTIHLHPDNSGGMLYEKDIQSGGAVEHRYFITAGGAVVAVVKKTGSGQTGVRYFHRDHLGSTTAITDETGAVMERLAYEPFGKRRFPAGGIDGGNTIAGVNTNRGFTNHEHLDALGLIHMNGRVYDPVIGRFMTADAHVPDPGNMQSYNRYAYVRNNPLVYVDPSGFFEDGLPDIGMLNSTFTGALLDSGMSITGGNSLDGYSYSGVDTNGGILVKCCLYANSMADAQISKAEGVGLDGNAYLGFINTASSFLQGSLVEWKGTGLNVMGQQLVPWQQPVAAEQAGRVAAVITDIGLSLMPGMGVLDAVNYFEQGNYWVGFGMLALEAAPFLKMGKGVVKGAAKGVATIDTAAVRFSQDSIKGAFRNGTTLNEAASALRVGGAEAAAKFPPIRLVEHEGQLFTLDNRRLLVFSQAGQQVPFRMATEAEIAREFANKFSTTATQGWGQFITVRP